MVTEVLMRCHARTSSPLTSTSGGTVQPGQNCRSPSLVDIQWPFSSDTFKQMEVWCIRSFPLYFGIMTQMDFQEFGSFIMDLSLQGEISNF